MERQIDYSAADRHPEAQTQTLEREYLNEQDRQHLQAEISGSASRIRTMPADDVTAEWQWHLEQFVAINVSRAETDPTDFETLRYLEYTERLHAAQRDLCERDLKRRETSGKLPAGRRQTSLSADQIGEIKTRNPLAEVVEGYGIRLKKSGKRFNALCPFHKDDKTPSLVLYPDEHYFCFSCQAQGDVIAFVQAYAKIGFREAVETLALRVGIDIPPRIGSVYHGENGKGPKPDQTTPAQVTDADAKKRVTTMDRIEALRQMGYTFRLNELDDHIEVNGERISDPVRAVIRSKMRDAGFNGMEAIEDSYTAEAYANRYHPIREYLHSLKWDGLPNIAILAAHFTNPDGAFEKWLRRWLIGSIAKALDGEQNPMLVLDGKQGIGKSYLVRWLCTLPEYHIESAIDTDDKDSLIRLISKWIWEVDELTATFRRADRDALKSFISRQVVTVRNSYGHFDMVKPALASFIGTVNDDGGILADRTGNRRFLVCTIDKIDWDYTQLDPAQVWAEACQAYRDGEQWKLTQDEIDLRNQINDTFEVEDPLEGWLAKCFEMTPGATTDWMQTTDVLKALEANGWRGKSDRADHMALASILKRKGLKRERQTVNRSQPWGYWGIKPTPKPPMPF